VILICMTTQVVSWLCQQLLSTSMMVGIGSGLV
jgi:hypothetical protein